MEDLDNKNPNPNQIEPIKISVSAAEITSKFKSIKDRQGFCREMSKIIFIIFRPFFPLRSRIRFHVLSSGISSG